MVFAARISECEIPNDHIQQKRRQETDKQSEVFPDKRNV